MLFVTGNNLFGQWLGCDDCVIDRFITLNDEKVQCVFDLKASTLVNIGWSHNIFHFNNKFYIAGDYKSSGQCLEQIHLPIQCLDSSNITIVSDDYHLFIIKKDTCKFWSVNLEDKEIKTLNLTTELPIEIDPKRSKKEDHILKCVATNGTQMFITNKNLVYCGLLPNLMDTRHCVGEPIDIQCGNEHYMLLTITGRLYTWGKGRRLQLGHGDVNVLDIPTEVEALAGIKIIKIAAGGWHSLAVSEFGDLYAWGWNDSGQLGIKESSDNKSLKSYSLPTLVDIFDDNGTTVNINIKDIACGSKHSAVLLDDDSVWTSGHNKYGQLGHSIQEHPAVYYYKKCCTFQLACGLICGPWSTVVNVIKPYRTELSLLRSERSL